MSKTKSIKKVNKATKSKKSTNGSSQKMTLVEIKNLIKGFKNAEENFFLHKWLEDLKNEGEAHDLDTTDLSKKGIQRVYRVIKNIILNLDNIKNYNTAVKYIENLIKYIDDYSIKQIEAACKQLVKEGKAVAIEEGGEIKYKLTDEYYKELTESKK